MGYVNDAPKGTTATHFACFHPWTQRRQYQGVEVCRECCSARTDGGYWESVCRLHYPDGSLRTLDGVTLYRDWQAASRR